MKKATVNDYFRHHWVKLMLFALFTAAVSFFAPLKNFQLKWLIDSKSKQEALGYMGLVFLITFTSWFFERLSRRSFTKPPAAPWSRYGDRSWSGCCAARCPNISGRATQPISPC